MTDDTRLERFLAAQGGGVHEQALAELTAGRKTSHWMWFVFPQVEGLGASAMSRRYAIRSAGEARAYLDHPVLGPRLRACTEALSAHKAGPDEGPAAQAILGGVDALKLKSSMTLFDHVAGPGEPFGRCLALYFGGERDRRTLESLA